MDTWTANCEHSFENTGTASDKKKAEENCRLENNTQKETVLWNKIWKKTVDFLKKAGTYYLATEEGDQPRVRSFGTRHIFEGRLYIQTGKVKEVSKQLLANPKPRSARLCRVNGFAYPESLWKTTGVRRDSPCWTHSLIKENVRSGRRKHPGILLQKRHGGDQLLYP